MKHVGGHICPAWGHEDTAHNSLKLYLAIIIYLDLPVTPQPPVFGAGFTYKYVTWDMPASICVGLTLSRCTYMGTQASSCVRIPVFTWGTTAFSCVWLASSPSCLGWPQLPAFTWGTPASSCLGFSHIHICIYLGYTSIQLC
jgi:hypothetical protein